jgi:uncharacterized membrane-anchored protein
MTWQHIDNNVRHQIGVLFATTLIVAGVALASLVGLWRVSSCSLCVADLRPRVIALGAMGVISYLATVINLLRLKRILSDFPRKTGSAVADPARAELSGRREISK